MTDALTTIWDASLEYRAFYDLSAQTFSLVTSCFTDDANCLEGKGILLVIRQADGKFCDFELALTGENAASAAEASLLPEMPEQVIPHSTVSYDVVCNVSIPLESKWILDLGRGRLSLLFRAEAPDRVFRLGKNAVWLGLVRELLGVVYVGDLIPDPSGRLESKWIELKAEGSSEEP